MVRPALPCAILGATAWLLSGCGADGDARRPSGPTGAIPDGGAAETQVDSPPPAKAALPEIFHLSRRTGGASVRVDGVLSEHPPLLPLTAGEGSDRASAKAWASYDDDNIYVAAEILDAGFRRTEAMGPAESRAELVLSFPLEGGGRRTYAISLFAGKPGEIAGKVTFHKGSRGEVPKARLVEAPIPGGHTLEAAIPWSAFPEAKTTRVGLRGVLRYLPAGETPLSTGRGSADQVSSLPGLLTTPEYAIRMRLVGPKGLAEQPDREIVANVSGDPRLERIAAYGPYLTVSGPGFGDGERFYFRDMGGPVTRLEARSVTGGPERDLIVHSLVTADGVTREIADVFRVHGETVDSAFSQELRVSQGDNWVATSLQLGPKAIDVTGGKSRGWDASSFRVGPVEGVHPVLVPWGPALSRSYQFDGQRFMLARETKNPKYQPAATREGEAPRPRVAAQPTAPSDDAARVLAKARADLGIAAGTRPTWDLTGDLSGDSRPERALVFGRTLIVLGPGIADGKGYAYVELAQAKDAIDLRRVELTSLRGPGHTGTVVVHMLRKRQFEGAVVEQEIYSAYDVVPAGFVRTFALELRRAMGDKSVTTRLSTSGQGGSRRIEVVSGGVVGWTAKTYPFTEEKPEPGQVQPLVLPWSSAPLRRYSWKKDAWVLSTDS